MTLLTPRSGSLISAVVRALRPHHWTKNVLVFLPLFLAHAWTDFSTIKRVALAALAFSLVASSVYVTNDLVDLEADRRHAKKRNRPFASGALPVSFGPPLAIALLSFGMFLSLSTQARAFTETLVFYFGLTLLYTFWLKRRLLVDVLVLVALYTLRLLAGGQAAGVPISEWLLAFSVFFFLSLAFLKRYSELGELRNRAETSRLVGRGYQVTDLSVIETVGPASGYLAVLVLALYVSSEQVRALYTNTAGLWMLCPLLLYWVTRVWFLAKRGDMDEDPIVFALTDRVSLLAGLVAAVLVGMAILGLGPQVS